MTCEARRFPLDLTMALVILLIQAAAALPWVTTVFANRSLTVSEMLRDAFKPQVLSASRRRGWSSPRWASVRSAPRWKRSAAWPVFLQLQLIVDFFILGFPLLMWARPKGGAVAFAAFREGFRQPMFWVLFLFGLLALVVSLIVPYFTFGEDLVYDELPRLRHHDAGRRPVRRHRRQSIHQRGDRGAHRRHPDEQPASRRQFLLGKFLGILMASLLMFALLGWVFEAILPVKAWLDRMDPVPLPTWLTSTLSWANLPDQATDLLRGVGLWVDQTLQVLPGLVMTFSEVTVLLAVSVALATRATMVVNLATVLAIYFLANVTPVLVTIGKDAQLHQPGPVSELLSFTAGLFDMLLPDLDAFRIGPAPASDVAVPARYVLSVLFYGVLYTLIVLLLGLVLFEDRDLA